jgi:hypothetical protein
LEELLLKEHKQRQKSKKRLNKKQKSDASLKLLAREANYAKTVLVSMNLKIPISVSKLAKS